jgi:hypothetical protein
MEISWKKYTLALHLVEMDPDRTPNPTADPDRRTLVADSLQIKIWQNDAVPTGTGSVSGPQH